MATLGSVQKWNMAAKQKAEGSGQGFVIAQLEHGNRNYAVHFPSKKVLDRVCFCPANRLKGRQQTPGASMKELQQLCQEKKSSGLRTQEPLADVAGTFEQIPAGTKANLSKFCRDVLSEMRKGKAEPVPGPGAPEQSPQDLACNTPAKKLKADAQTCAPEEAAEPSEPLEYDLDNIDHCIAWVLAAFSSTRRESLQDVASFFVQNDLKPRVKKCFPLSAVFRDRVMDKGLLKTSQARTLWLNAWSQSRAKRFVPGPAQVWQKKTAVSSAAK